MNIDAQDNQDGRLLQETLTRAMIACGFEDVREHKPAVSGKNPVHPLHPCESKIYPCLTMNRFPATRRRGLFQVSRAPAPHDGRIMRRETGVFQASRASAPHDGADHSRVKQVLFQTSRASAPHDGADHSRVKQVLFQTSRASAPHDGADHSRVKQVLFQTRQVGSAQRNLYPEGSKQSAARC